MKNFFKNFFTRPVKEPETVYTPTGFTDSKGVQKTRKEVRTQPSIAGLMMITVISLMLTGVFWNYANTAYEKGARDKYMEVSTQIKKAQEAINNIKLPEKSEVYFPDQANAAGEIHSRLRDGVGLGEFVYNNCTPEVHEVYTDVVEYSESQGIRPEIVFAVAWADSQCGHNLTTAFNYGNVNNNDRGDRVGFLTPFEGWKAIVDVLNNNLMGGLTMVGQLSQGGRTGTDLYEGVDSKYSCSNAPAPYKCYATSIENHFNNTMRALECITGKRLDGTWLFRQ